MVIRWRDACVKASCSIRQALEVINRSSLRAAFVLDDNDQLRGMVTDGDIRRGLLANIALTLPVSTVMNASPLCCTIHDSRDSVRRLMEAKGLLHMPVVQEGKLVDVYALQDLMETVRRDNPVFLMAGGYGTRLQPLTERCPKPLLKVGKKPILEIILDGFVDQGFHNFFISTHYLPEQVKSYFGDGSRWGVTINYTYEDQPLGTGGALGLLPDDLPALPLLMMNGDILTRVNFASLVDYHAEATACVTMCVREHEYQVPYGVVNMQDFEVTGLVEKPVYRHHINAGIYVINPEVARQVAAGQNIDMPTLIAQQIQNGGRVATYPLDEYWLDIGRMNDFERAQQDVLDLFSS